MALAVTVNLIHGQLSYQLETNTHYVQKLQHKSLLSKLLLQHNWCAFTFFFCGKSINHCICSRQLQRGHADGGFPVVEVDPRLGEAVVVGRGERAGEQRERRASYQRAPPHRRAVRRVLEEHLPVASVVGGLHQTSQQARLSDDECHPV